MVKEEIELDQTDMAGNTPLHLAAREGKLPTISTLLNHGAQVDKKVTSLSILS